MCSFDDLQGADCTRIKMQLFPVFDENRTAILPCGKKTCVTAKGKPYKPVPTRCAGAECKNTFRFPCPGIIFCCEECFEATGTQKECDEARPETPRERKKRLGKRRKRRNLATDKGKEMKSKENHLGYLRRKAKQILEDFEKEELHPTVPDMPVDDSVTFVSPNKPIEFGPTTSSEEMKKTEKVTEVPAFPMMPDNFLIKLAPPDEKPSPLVSILENPEYKVCRYFGCNEQFLDDKPYWGRDRKFCCQEHRDRMVLLFHRVGRLFKITKCPFLRGVLKYLRLVSGRDPP